MKNKSKNKKFKHKRKLNVLYQCTRHQNVRSTQGLEQLERDTYGNHLDVNGKYLKNTSPATWSLRITLKNLILFQVKNRVDTTL